MKPNPNREPQYRQFRPFAEIGSFLCRLPGSEIVWSAPMLADAVGFDSDNVGPVEFDMIDDDVADRIRAIADANFPRTFDRTTAADRVAQLRANVAALSSGAMDHDEFTRRQREAWDAISARGNRFEEKVLRILRGDI